MIIDRLFIGAIYSFRRAAKLLGERQTIFMMAIFFETVKITAISSIKQRTLEDERLPSCLHSATTTNFLYPPFNVTQLVRFSEVQRWAGWR
jgi:hypothetical protein